MAPVDKEMANLLHARIREEGSIFACAPASLPSKAWRCLPKTAAVATAQRVDCA